VTSNRQRQPIGRIARARAPQVTPAPRPAGVSKASPASDLPLEKSRIELDQQIHHRFCPDSLMQRME
jgi:hypothetical protein